MWIYMFYILIKPIDNKAGEYSRGTVGSRKNNNQML